MTTLPSTITITSAFAAVFLARCCSNNHLRYHSPPPVPAEGSYCPPVRNLPSSVAAFRPSPRALAHPSSATSLRALEWPSLSSFAGGPSKKSTVYSSGTVGTRNGHNPEYPWKFEGRFIFRPSLVKVSNAERPPSADLLSIFGYSLGGSVVLEYDVSPVGPYREYVTMGGVVALGKVKAGGANEIDERMLGIGQWGTNLYVSTQVAEQVCREIWGVPAQVANIEFAEIGDELNDRPDNNCNNGGKRKFIVGGWENTRIVRGDNTAERYGNIPIFWTPTIKALWAPLLLPGGGTETMSAEYLLPLHKLRLSASAIRLKKCRRILPADSGVEVPLGVALVADNVLIEIGERMS